MKILLIIGIIVIFVLILFIYKKSKGEDLIDFSINEGFAPPKFNAEEDMMYEDLNLDDVNMNEIGKEPKDFSAQNEEEAKLLKNEPIPAMSPGDDMSGQSSEIKNWINVTSQDKLKGQGNLFEDKINDPGNLFKTSGEMVGSQKFEKKGSKFEIEYPETPVLDESTQDFEVEGDEDSPPAGGMRLKKMTDISGSVHNDTDIARKIAKCESLNHCGELNDNECGFCMNDGSGKFYYGFGNKKGPLTNVCAKKKWTTNKDQCIELQDRKKCSESKDDCALIPQQHDNLCGFCPATGKVIPYTKSGANKMVKYSGTNVIEKDSCNYDWQSRNLKGPILSGEECVAFSKNNPCITPYHRTGPHTKSCLKKLWQTSGCTGDLPYNKSLDDMVNNKVDELKNTGYYKDIQSKMKLTQKEMKSNDISKVIKSTMWCENRESDVNPCDNKYHGTGSVNNNNRGARILCREKVWKNSGCEDAGKENPITLLKEKGKFSTEYTKILNETSLEYKNRIMDLPVKANKTVSVDDFPKKKKASQDCYGRDPPPPSKVKAGYFIRYEKRNNMKLWGYLTEMNAMGHWQVMWVAKQMGTTKINRQKFKAIRGDTKIQKKKKLKTQKKEFGWPGIKADDKKMNGLELHLPTNDMIIEDECNPGITMCGNSCNLILSKLFDDYPRPQDCVLSGWSGWSVCSKPCKVGGTPGVRTRARYIIEEAKRGGAACPLQDKLIEEESCNNIDCYNASFVKESFGNKKYEKAGVFDAKGKKGRYIQISHTSYIHIQEIEVYNDQNVNVALKKNGGNASASDSGWGATPNKINDGNKSDFERWPNSSHTRRGGNRWVRITLPQNTTITRIVVYNRPDCCQTVLVGATLTVFDNDWKEKVSFNLTSKRKQIYHLGTENVFNHGNDASCKTLKIPIQATDQEILNKKNEMSGNNPTNVKDGTCMSKIFEKSKTNPKGGDCDWSGKYFKWYGWGSRHWSVEKCAQKCLDTKGCNRFTFGKSNRWGGWGLGCRVSKDQHGGFCPLTTDRYAANGWSWWGNSNYWGGTVYDKKGKKPTKPYEWVGDFLDSKRWNWYWGPKMGKDTKYKGRVA